LDHHDGNVAVTTVLTIHFGETHQRLRHKGAKSGSAFLGVRCQFRRGISDPSASDCAVELVAPAFEKAAVAVVAKLYARQVAEERAGFG
jgi:hypothetical protein